MNIRNIIKQILNEEFFLNENHSKFLTNSEGQKILFYHGTNTPNLKFNELKQSNLAGDYGTGIYLTSNKKHAQRHGDFIVSGYVNSQNPLIIGSKDYFNKIYLNLPGAEIGIPKMNNLADIAKKLSYDCILIEKNIDDIWAIILKENMLFSL